MPELELIFGKNELSKDNLLLGKSAVYNNLNISVPLNSFFANHSAIIGNTGSGKSCGIARILQNLFLVNPVKPINAHVILFDAYGEYINAFNELNDKDGKTNFKIILLNVISWIIVLNFVKEKLKLHKEVEI